MSMLKNLSSRWSSKGDDRPTDSYLRRREQVRRAQKNHRRRKEEYHKSLEAEVVHLRTRESDLLKQTCELSAEVEWLKTIIVQHCITIPSRPAEAASSGQHDLCCHSSVIVSVDKNYLSCERLLVQDFVSSEPTHHNHDGSYLGVGVAYPARSGIDELEEPSSNTILDEFNNNAGLVQENNIISAMEFILSLEGPCLDHVRAALGTPQVPNGHALTLTASMLHLCENSGSSAQRLDPTQIPKKTVERLLELSSELSTEDELTPTQAWVVLSRQPQFTGTSKTQIVDLANALLSHMKCYGFGAVIERMTLMNEISRVLNCPARLQLD
ncbi:uncharacterized protein N7473_008049 [Penicillium subrubescens]|uniref:uncharacterized protein n=1 Tax=Penicillium subrubescens TaxID=1316194 RepID=UPI002545B569|nr:uncharacterized protein N7473_008049 [Penicillium subrubescens]KAJ5891821.1 hypothetical protein N7473_008049 [Penicillium subrubescens]